MALPAQCVQPLLKTSFPLALSNDLIPEMAISEPPCREIRQNGERSVGVSKNEPFSEHAARTATLPTGGGECEILILFEVLPQIADRHPQGNPDVCQASPFPYRAPRVWLP